ncbi:MAG: hypothetical protein ABWX96_15550 [Propionibacteriaceae bacterium]
MLMNMIVAVLMAGAVGLLVCAGWWGRRRAELPMMLVCGGFAVVALAIALVVADAPSPLPAGLLGAAALVLAAAGVARRLEDATHCLIVEDEGGPAASTSGSVGLPQVLTAFLLLVAGGVVLIARSGATAWAVASVTAAMLPLVVAHVVRLIHDRQQRDATTGYEHELAFWAWELTEDQLLALEVRLENARLARVLGLAPSLRVAHEPAPPVQQHQPGIDAEIAHRRPQPSDPR